jgi:hypothetical protein
MFFLLKRLRSSSLNGRFISARMTRLVRLSAQAQRFLNSSSDKPLDSLLRLSLLAVKLEEEIGCVLETRKLRASIAANLLGS